MMDSSRRIGRTGHADVDGFLDDVRGEVESALRSEFLGMYVGGSLALGGFDRASDIDVVIATSNDVRHHVVALRAAHRRLARARMWFAKELECIYMPATGLRRFAPALSEHLKLDRGTDETLRLDMMDESWVVHCHILRTHGITWAGPDPTTLIDVVSRADLNAAMRGLLAGWATGLLRRPDSLQAPGYQSYTVLSVCRILHTLSEGMVVSKAAAAAWALIALPAEWHHLVNRAVEDRMRDRVRASHSAVAETLELVEYAQQSARLRSE